ncbi:MAG: arginine--tRNA ligase, partial [Spirochaetales bacterium]
MVCIAMHNNTDFKTMSALKLQCTQIIADTLTILAGEKNITPEGPGCDRGAILASAITPETPPDPTMGDIGIPMYIFAKMFRTAPQKIAEEVSDLLQHNDNAKTLGTFTAVGPYVNIKQNKSLAAHIILAKILAEGDAYGKFDDDGNSAFENRRVMIEFSSPNTNKPLHLGHLRNDALGESCSRILTFAGADVFKVNII